jgi:hypothetical protein
MTDAGDDGGDGSDGDALLHCTALALRCESAYASHAQVHGELVRLLLNPFQPLDGKIESAGFAKSVRDFGAQYLSIP